MEKVIDRSSKKAFLQTEIKRIANQTLRGVFVKAEDREFWVLRLQKLTSELRAIEEIESKLRKRKAA